MRSISDNSLYVEKALQHTFIASLYQRIWQDERCPLLEVSSAEIDNRGYDVVLTVGHVTRHVQLKSTKEKGGCSAVNISLELEAKPSGCVVWYTYDPSTLGLKQFRFFGGEPGKRLPDISNQKKTKQTRANAAGVKAHRRNHRRVKRSDFRIANDLPELITWVFGEMK
jgi:hypothetical protein